MRVREGVVDHQVVDLVVRMPASANARAGDASPRGREVLHLTHHRSLGALAAAEHEDRAGREVSRALGRDQHQRAASVGHEAALEQVERPGDDPRREHVGNADRIAVHGARIPAGPLALHDRDHRELLVGQPEVLHVAERRDREDRRWPGGSVRRLGLADRPMPPRAGRRRRERPLCPCVMSTVLHWPEVIAATAWRTWIMNEQPPTAVPSSQLGVMPR
jgi:hypothetical protein